MSIEPVLIGLLAILATPVLAALLGVVMRASGEIIVWLIGKIEDLF